MAFNFQNLQRASTANSNAKSLWLYASADDDYAAISGANYFDEAVDKIQQGDKLMVEDSAGVQTLTFCDSNDGTTLTIATGNTIAA